jgi:AraC-like DNA-binding protein
MEQRVEPAAAPEPPAFLRVSTRPVPPSDRFEYWRGLFGGMDIQPVGREARHDFNGEFVAHGGPGAQFFALKSDPNMARLQAPATEEVLLSFLNAGAACLPDEDEVITPDGRLFIVDCGRRPTFISAGHHNTYLVLPRATVMEAMGGDAVMRRRTKLTLPDTGLARVLASHLRSIESNADGLDVAGAASAVHAASTLATAVLRLMRPGHREQQNAGLVLAARRMIELDHGDARLSAEAIAARLGCSRTQLFSAFQAENLSLADCLRDARLNRGKMLLADRSRPVDEVAWLCGYSDASAFGKAFRRAFGMTPGEWRGAASAPPSAGLN